MKNFRNDRGVTGGGFFGLRRKPASEAMDGGDEGISCEDGGRTGSDRGTSGRSWPTTIVYREEAGRQTHPTSNKSTSEERTRGLGARRIGGADASRDINECVAEILVSGS